MSEEQIVQLTAVLREQGYEVLELLGRGGYGDVFKVRDMKLSSVLALKILRELSEHNFRRFQQEARFAARLQHPNIAKSLKFGITTDFVYIVYEFVEGQSLDKLLLKKESVDAEVAVKITLQLLAALGTAHNNGILHRDVKPSNIIVDDHANIKLLDFGVAILMQETQDQRLTRSNQLVGSIAYMAPESLSKAKLDPKADLYSVGCVLYQMLEGRVPFSDPFHREEVPILLKCGTPLAEIVLRLLQREPANRFETSSAVIEALSTVDLLKERPPMSKCTNSFRCIIVAVVALSTVVGFALPYSADSTVLRNCARVATSVQQNKCAIFLLRTAVTKEPNRSNQANDYLEIARLTRMIGQNTESDQSLRLGFMKLVQDYKLTDDGGRKIKASQIGDLYTKYSCVRSCPSSDALITAAEIKSGIQDHAGAYALWQFTLMDDARFRANQSTALIQSMLGREASLLGRHGAAIKHLVAALEKTTSPANRAELLIALSGEYNNVHQPQPALYELRKAARELNLAAHAIEEAEDTETLENRKLFFYEINTRTLLNLGRIPEAKQSAGKLLSLASNHEDRNKVAAAYVVMAEIATSENKTGEVVRFLEQARDMYRQQGRTVEAKQTEININDWRRRLEKERKPGISKLKCSQ